MAEKVLSSERVTHSPEIYEHRPVTASTSTVVGRRDDLQAAFVEAFVDEPNRRSNLVMAVIPAYNEDRFIGSVVLKTRGFVDQVIVVDDGSSDQTATIASEAGAEVMMHPVNQGKAEALKTGFARACELGADIVVTLDGDGQHNPAEIPGVIRPILRGQADMVIGSRFLDTKSRIPAWRRVGQRILTLVTNVTSGIPSSDSQSGFRAFSSRALAALRIRCEGFAVESELQFWAREHSLRVAEASISCVYVEKSKRNPFRHGLQVLNGIIELVSRSRPLLFFGLSGLLTALLGIVWWWWILRAYHQTNELALGYALLATLLIILGVLATFEGVTLHTLRRIAQHLPRQPVVTGPTDDLQGALVSAQELQPTSEHMGRP